MRKKPAETRWRVVPIRLDPALIRRLDRLVERRQRSGAFVTRSDLIRMYVVRGLDDEEGGSK